MDDDPFAKTLCMLTCVDDYPHWASKMEGALWLHRLWGYVSGDIPKPVLDSTSSDVVARLLLKDWENMDSTAMSYMNSYIKSRSILNSTAHAKTSKEMWDGLLEGFQPGMAFLRVKLRREFYAFELNPDEPIAPQVEDLLSLWGRLVMLEDPAPHREFWEQVLHVLGFIERWEYFALGIRCSLDAEEDLQPWRLYQRIASAEAWFRDRDENRMAQSFPQGTSGRPDVTCYACGEVGHFANKCPSRPSRGRRCHRRLRQ